LNSHADGAAEDKNKRGFQESNRLVYAAKDLHPDRARPV